MKIEKATANAHAERARQHLNTAAQLREKSAGLERLLVASLIFLAICAGLLERQRRSDGLTHYDRVQMLRLVDDINR